MNRLSVAKTYKLYIGGAFVRSESGRSYPIADGTGAFFANLPAASRKDARDAVVAARAAQPGWAAASAYNRGQVLYRVAEVLEARREAFVDELARLYLPTGDADRRHVVGEVDAAIDRWVWYAGWTDKYAQVVGNANPVSGPYFNLSVPEPTGVVAIICPQDIGLLGAVSVLAPALATGNTVVAVTSERYAPVALSLAEVIATSDVPAGVVNILSGSPEELLSTLSTHQDVNGLDLAGARDLDWVGGLARASETLTRTMPPHDGAAPKSLDRLAAWVEIKTVWHTKSIR